MTAPPAHYPPLPYNRQIALLKTRDIPLHFYRYLIDRVGRKWHWVNVLRMQRRGARRRHPRAGPRHPRALSRRRAGRLLRHQAACLPDEAELAYFGMMEHAIGQGLGRWFLGAAVEAAWSHGPKQVTVQTCTLDHPAALPLYQRLGFSPGRRRSRRGGADAASPTAAASVMRP